MEPWKKKTILFIASQTASMFGSAVVGFSIIWYITLETSSGAMMTIATLCNFIPQILISLPAGVLADRYSRKTLIMAADGCVAVTTLALALLIINGKAGLPLIFLAMALRSLFGGIQSPAVGAIIPQIVPGEHLLRVNAINTTINSASQLLAPVVGGVVLAGFGFGYSLLVDTVTAVLAIAIFSFLAVPRLERSDAASPIADLREGLRYMRSSRFVRVLLIFYTLAFFLISPASFLTPLLVERSFGAEVWRLTANEVSWSIGMVLGGIVVSVWGGFSNRVRSLAVAMLAWGVTFALMGVVGNFWVYLTIMLISGLFLPLFSSAEMTLIQEQVPAEMLGRVFAVINLVISIIMPIAMLGFGPLADIVSVELIMVVTGILMAVLSIPIFGRNMLALDTNAGKSKEISGADSQPNQQEE